MKNYIYFSFCFLIVVSFVFATVPAELGGNENFANLIKMQMNNLGLPRDSNSVIYSDQNLSAYVIAERSRALAADQVCISIGKNRVRRTFRVIERGKIVEPLGNYRVNTTVICDRMNYLENTISDYPSISNFQYVDLENDCSFDLTSTSRACLIVLGNTSPGPAINRSSAGGISFGGLILTILLILVVFGINLVIAFFLKGFSKKMFYLFKFILWILLYILVYNSTSSAMLWAAIVLVLLQPILSFMGLNKLKSEIDGKKTVLFCKIMLFAELALVCLFGVIYLFGQLV